MLLSSDIIFPNLHIEIKNMEPQMFNLFGIPVYWYGVIIGMGVLIGLFIATREAKRTNQDPNIYIDFLMYALITSIIGARLYYVIFSWKDYKDNLIKIFAIREGGLAIYGGIIAAIITLIIYTKIKKLSFWKLADTACLGLVIGQAIGRWGNFFNREAFGGYTDSIFAMMLKKSEVNLNNLAPEVLNKIVSVDGIEYLKVQPTFFYESLWNVGVFALLIFLRDKKKFNGEIFALYILGYALGRSWIEGLRTDQLLMWGTNIAISQVLSIIAVIIAATFIVIKRKNVDKNIM